MRYSIITLNKPERQHYIKNIRRHMAGTKEVFTKYLSTPDNAASRLKSLDIHETEWQPTPGERAVWAAHATRWFATSVTHDPMIVFEDDATIHPNFLEKLDEAMKELPDDWDFLSLWVPNNQRQDYMYDLVYDNNGEPTITGYVKDKSLFDFGATKIAKVYQGYGLVATMYSNKGGRKLWELARKYGMTTPVDCFVMQHAHAERLKGFAPKPLQVFVDYDWPPTTR